MQSDPGDEILTFDEAWADNVRFYKNGIGNRISEYDRTSVDVTQTIVIPVQAGDIISFEITPNQGDWTILSQSQFKWAYDWVRDFQYTGGTPPPDCVSTPDDPCSLSQQIWNWWDDREAEIDVVGRAAADSFRRIRDFIGESDIEDIFVNEPGYYAVNPDPGNKPVLERPGKGRVISPEWIDAPIKISGGPDLIDLLVHGTCSDGCDDFNWFIQRLDPDQGFQPVPGFWGFQTGNAFTRTGFADDGALHRAKVWQSQWNQSGWTVEHNEWSYFWNGTPQGPPKMPEIVAPTSGEVNASNFIFFTVSNPSIEMMHPNFKYQIQVYEVPSGGPAQINPNSPTTVFNGVRPQQRGDLPPMGVNLDPLVLPNQTKKYYWRVAATYANDFTSEPARVIATPLRELTVTGLPFWGDNIDADFGFDIDQFGRFAVVGAPKSDYIEFSAFDEEVGSVSIYIKDDSGVWQEEANPFDVTPLNTRGGCIPPMDGRMCGYAVSIQGDLVAISCPDMGYGNDGSIPPEGIECDNYSVPHVGVLRRTSPGVWAGVWYASIGPNMTGRASFFGASVEIGSDNTIYVGEPYYGTDIHPGNEINESGRVNVYVPANGIFDSWSTADFLSHPSIIGGVPINGAGRSFGSSLAVEGSVLAVGAPAFYAGPQLGQHGAVYLYNRTGSTWALVQQEIVALDHTSNDQFGALVHLDKHKLYVGAPNALGGGAVYVFEKQNGLWVQIQKLQALDDITGDERFGTALAVSENLMLVGAPGDDRGTGTDNGAVYAWSQSLLGSVAQWNQQTKLPALPGPSYARFGTSMSLWGSSAIVGAPEANHPDDGVTNDRRGTIDFLELDLAPPIAYIIAPDTPDLTNANTVTFRVLFNEPVQNIDSSNMRIRAEGVTFQPPLISLVPGAGNDSQAWQVRLENVAGNGKIGLAVGYESYDADFRVTDRNGNPLVASVLSYVDIDQTPPAIANTSLNMSVASPGDAVRLSFTVSEAMFENPNVTFNGLQASLKSLNGVATQGEFRTDYIYEYPVTPSDAFGAANIQIQASDEAGNLRTLSLGGLTIQAGGADSDGDGLSDAAETALGTSSTGLDSDGDGIFDGQEVDAGTSPTNGLTFTRMTSVYVQIGYTGVQKGTVANPVDSLIRALRMVSPGGAIWFKNGGPLPETPRITTQVTIDNLGAAPVIGQNSHASPNVPMTIPDVSTINSTLVVPVSATISDINVRLDLTHAYDGDLVIQLFAPDATMVTLFNRRGGGGRDIRNIVFDDEGATPIATGGAPFTGTYRPEVALSLLDGKNAQGTWTLRISDNEGEDTGLLNSWSLEIH